MRIMFHSYTYESGWTYQENLLPQACIEMGHEVLCVASKIGITEDGNIEELNTDADPEYVYRLPAFFARNIQISYRLRKLKGFYEVMESFHPDVVFVHVVQTLNLTDIAKYKKKHTNVRVYYNTHTDYYTSGRNVISRILLHRLFYKILIQRYLYLADRFFYISLNCAMFLWEEYKIPKEKTEFMPIGASIATHSQLADSRRVVLDELHLDSDSIIFIQAGKLDAKKHIMESLYSFTATRDQKFVLLVVGKIDTLLQSETDKIIKNDTRIKYLGWKSGEELFKYLRASDFYIQPGKGSVLFENAICCSCAIIAKYLMEYDPFISGNGWLINELSELSDIYSYISKHKEEIEEMKNKSNKIACRMLDQNELVKKIK